ncbi:bifunctional 5,10-methylenetetrahydrofolate dehydrogenase/5,10-methenyltetrahydrofolate cyclohydrolase [Deinococcus yavapaiensis]|uniref:Bifunctional protein FolD n=1 Tax=Deinococcus yavapaiensis KR-236 TaxID=694435 RepID=A0A318SA24_9DEIO|nr:bifunctional 5,10-methylenetetrahydrofolate dehydrogenase/5,10-methenyltetrahydrofolate cyclohydrolase [Deinococcus yavapaiensis]PYE54910.1 methylenetetrahydrofolate dehydrogenase (NADP+)/methenyltetrahydrofolate cyclohydrolase [Deinococcus yavapaiensis KR-236]
MTSAQQLQTRLLQGAPLAADVTRGTKARLAPFAHLCPVLAVVMASNDSATRVYVDRKAARARKLGIELRVVDLGQNVDQAHLEAHLLALSRAPDVHGIVLELPLACHLDADRALACITPSKDVEGLSPANLALIAAGREREAILPPTPTSCVTLLSHGLDLDGAHVAVIGPGRTVGRPLVWMLNNRGATVTVVNHRTKHLGNAVERCDAVVVAVGQACLLEARHLKAHHVVVDAGINVVANVVVGDCASDVADAVRAITPVPGGVGPLTSALMLANFARALELQAPST